MTSILGPRGTPMVELAGERAWRVRTIGDIVCSYQWIDLRSAGDESAKGDPEPCMCLYAAHRRTNAAAYVIPMRNAYAYVDKKGRPTPQLLKTSALAAETLGFDMNDRSSITRMLDIICEGIPDLINMPTEQPNALEVRRAKLGMEVTAKAGGQVLQEEIL